MCLIAVPADMDFQRQHRIHTFQMTFIIQASSSAYFHVERLVILSIAICSAMSGQEQHCSSEELMFGYKANDSFCVTSSRCCYCACRYRLKHPCMRTGCLAAAPTSGLIPGLTRSRWIRSRTPSSLDHLGPLCSHHGGAYNCCHRTASLFFRPSNFSWLWKNMALIDFT